MSSEKKLNKQQLKAIHHGTGPLLIIAGAGTGKTTVITERIKWLVGQNLAKTDEILALTFTEKAAREMEDRVDVAMPYGYTQMWIMTFHSFCDRILRDHGFHIGLDPAYRLLTGVDSLAFLKKNIFDLKLDYYLPLGNPAKFLSGLLNHFSRLQDEDIAPGEYEAYARKTGLPESIELAAAFGIYSGMKIKNSYMDFPDLITNALRLFRDRPRVLQIYRKKFKYLLIDEFQDTNFAQNRLLELLAGKDGNITVVGDDDQSIYRWRGAAVSNVIQFRKNYPQAKLVVLNHNYRSTKEILNSAYSLIQHNNPDRLEVVEKINKRLIPARKVTGAPVELIHTDRGENEADLVAQKILELTNSPINKLTYKDIAILVRANAHSGTFIKSLDRHGIPSQFLGPAKLFQQPEVKDLIAYLTILNDLDDDASLYRVLSMETFSLPARDLAVVSAFAKRLNLSLFAACEIISGHILPSPSVILPAVSDKFKTSIADLVTHIHSHLSLVPKQTAGQILYSFLETSGLLKHILDSSSSGNVIKFFNKLKSFESDNADSSVSSVLDWIELSAEAGESPAATDTDWTQNDAVNILTIHSAKGLEFPVVFLVNLVSQRFPTTEKSELIPIPDALIKEILPSGDYHLQEERRLFYVGLTRARDRLFLTAADFYGEGKRVKKLSPFITESLGPGFMKLACRQAGQLSLLDWSPQPKSKSQINKLTNPQVTYLSYSQIQTFLTCPLHYKARYILKIPTPPSAASSFGNTIHRVLKEFYSQAVAAKAAAAKKTPDISEILHRFWDSAGYTSKKHEQAYYSKGLKILSEYVSEEFDPHRLPIKLEEPFITKVVSDDKSKNLKIGGKIDRIDPLPDGRIEIIDYKTSTKIPSAKEVDSDLQLSIYALAAGVPPEKIVLSLYFFEDRKKISTSRSADQLQEAKTQIFSYAAQIESSDFRCSGSPICRRCDYRPLCDIDTN
jgi:DNA helicase-2/ATP-dependent DNA helicase PcrA